jgi:peptide-methionine (S)-S-oxide reductase
MAQELKLATFASGCFWCTEAIFQRLKGVESVASGFSGGHIKNPAYREVVTGRTGHAECTQIKYDPAAISYAELLEIFWKTHDPTTLNRQGHDVGTHYRSAIFYHDDEQKQLAESYKMKLDEGKIWNDPIVTEITKYEAFFKAEGYHDNYFNLNGSQPYCSFVIQPKVDKLIKIFADKLKK